MKLTKLTHYETVNLSISVFFFILGTMLFFYSEVSGNESDDYVHLGHNVWIHIDDFPAYALEHGDQTFTEEDHSYVHMGHNVWVHKDDIQEYAAECLSNDMLSRTLGNFSLSREHQKHWTCPYCHHHWPIGTSCSTKDCESLNFVRKKKEDKKSDEVVDLFESMPKKKKSTKIKECHL